MNAALPAKSLPPAVLYTLLPFINIQRPLTLEGLIVLLPLLPAPALLLRIWPRPRVALVLAVRAVLLLLRELALSVLRADVARVRVPD